MDHDNETPSSASQATKRTRIHYENPHPISSTAGAVPANTLPPDPQALNAGNVSEALSAEQLFQMGCQTAQTEGYLLQNAFVHAQYLAQIIFNLHQFFLKEQEKARLLENNNRQLTTRLEKMSQENDELEQKIEQLRNQHQQTLTEFKNKDESQATELSQKNLTICGLDRDLKTAETEKHTLMAEIAELQADNKTLAEEIHILETTVNSVLSSTENPTKNEDPFGNFGLFPSSAQTPNTSSAPPPAENTSTQLVKPPGLTDELIKIAQFE